MTREFAIARRVVRQIVRDRRFLALAIGAPLGIIRISKVALDATNVPFMNVSRFVVPIGAIVVHFATYVLCALVLVRERTSLTLDRLFVNGYSSGEIVQGYMAAYTLIATLQAVLAMTEMSWLFHLRYGPSLFLSLLAVFWLLAVISICLGIFVSNFARTEGQVLPMIPLVTVPGIFLSDIIFPVDRFPGWAQAVSHATPLYYANRIIQKLLDGGTLIDNPARVAALAGYGMVVLVLAVLTLRERD